jgi:DNA topoisomerase-6 subunit B
MYGLITTGKPIGVLSRTGARSHAHQYLIAIDTKKNRPDIIEEKMAEVTWPHGTEVAIELEASYNRGRASVDEYLELTAIANPHARFVYHPPEGETVEFPRGTDRLPAETKEIKPHPYGIELGTFLKMLKETQCKKIGAFLGTEFSRVSPAVAKQVCAAARVTPLTWVNAITPPEAEKLYSALQGAKLKAPSTDCLAPMGAEAILQGLLRGIKAEMYTASTRPPAVYRGNPFQIEVGLAYGGQLGSDRHDEEFASAASDAKGDEEEVSARAIRFANRVPLLYQQSSCCLFKAVIDTKWNNYGLSQSSGALPRAPMVILIHMASVWVPFISEGKEAIADYDEIRKEVKLAIAECGRRLGTLLKRKRTRADYSRRRDVFTRYIDEVVESVRAITTVNKEEFRKALLDLARTYTARADMEFDEHGKIVKKSAARNELGLEDTIVIPPQDGRQSPGMLIDVGPPPPAKGSRKKDKAR